MKTLIEQYRARGLQPAQILENCVALGYDKYEVQDMLREIVLYESQQLLQE